MPPNTTQGYDYSNNILVESDIEDWTPAGTGQQKAVNAQTWRNIPYNWPYGVLPEQQTESHWYIYWMQNMPGLGNTIPDGTNRMTNWWTFTADWDASITAKLGLYESASCAFSVTPTSQFFDAGGGTGSVTVTTGNGCARAVISNVNWITVTSGASESGSGTVNFTVAPNTSTTEDRTGTLVIADQILIVTQSKISCATGISERIGITRGGFRYNHTTERFVQSVLIRNTSDTPVAAPMVLVLDSLSVNATLFNKRGLTTCAVPSGSPYINVAVGDDGVLNPGEVVTVILEFTNPSNQGVTYSTRVLAGSADR